MSRLRKRDERGATLVEAALVLPLIMLFILGMVDLAQWNFHKSQASSAARDGARTAIIGAQGADTVGSTANTRIRTAIAGRLGGQSFTYSVVCLPSTGTSTVACNVTPSTVDRYRVRVTVTWQRNALSFVGNWFGATQTITGTSTMTISG